ncbi:MAG TPA: serine hydrolase [Allosphingosinicella sp.]|nr:serine hydrolase [Allosphingosinicella sp.]
MNPAHPGVTRENWRSHPHSVWAFQNLASFLPTVEVPAGDWVRRFDERPVDLSGLCFEAPDHGRLSWTGFLDSTHSDAMLVLRRGTVLFEHYANGMAADTPHMLFSVTKSVVGLLAEMLIERNVLEEAGSASDYVAELVGSPFGQATVRGLLDMRDGVRFDEDYANPRADIHLYSAAYWGSAQGGVAAALPGIGTAGEPDAFAYRTPVTDVLGWCLTRAAGMPLSRLVSELLWQPIGAERPAFFVCDTAGHEIAAAGFNATLPDVGRFAQMLANDGVVEGKQVVSRAIVERIAAGGSRAAFAQAGMATRPGWSYRSHWWVPPEQASFCALGVFGQRVLVDAAEDLCIVRFGSHPIASNTITDDVHAAAFGALRRFLAHLP